MVPGVVWPMDCAAYSQTMTKAMRTDRQAMLTSRAICCSRAMHS